MGKCFRSRDQWFQTPLGQRLLAAEVSTLQQILPQLFGYHLLQISAIGNGQLLESSRITHRCILTHSPDYPLHHYYSHVCALAEILPFSQDSLDVVILPHILEFEDNPHKVLREIQRILIPEGHVVLLGFNPFSLWGIYHLLLSRRQTAPWCSHFLPLLRIKDWLALLSFEVVEQQVLFFALPLKNDKLRHITALLEQFGARFTKNFGAVYLLVAKKRVAPLTPINKIKKRTQPAIVPNAVSTQFEVFDDSIYR